MLKYTFVALIFLMACSQKVLFTNSDVSRANIKFPGATAESLKSGREHYKTYCQSCHLLKPVSSQTEEGWRNIVPGMVAGANKKAGKTEITPEIENSILAYLVTMANAPKSK